LTVILTLNYDYGENMTIYFSFPFQINSKGRNTVVDENQHIKQQIEIILFTSPGERLNHPTFGCGLNQIIFENNDAEIIASTKYLIQSSLQYWLSEVIDIKFVDIQNIDSLLYVSVSYTIKQTDETFSVTFKKEVVS